MMRKWEPATTTSYKTVVVITSTYGDGGPPVNAEKLYRWLESNNDENSLKYGTLLISNLYLLCLKLMKY